MSRIDLNAELSTIPPYINNGLHRIKIDTKSFENAKKIEKVFRDVQLKKLKTALLKEIDLFQRRKREHNKRVEKYKILINYAKTYQNK